VTDKEIRTHGYYLHDHFGILRIVDRFKEGHKYDRHTVYIGVKPGDPCSYNAMAYEFTQAATREQWEAQPKPTT